MSQMSNLKGKTLTPSSVHTLEGGGGEHSLVLITSLCLSSLFSSSSRGSCLSQPLTTTSLRKFRPPHRQNGQVPSNQLSKDSGPFQTVNTHFLGFPPIRLKSFSSSVTKCAPDVVIIQAKHHPAFRKENIFLLFPQFWP